MFKAIWKFLRKVIVIKIRIKTPEEISQEEKTPEQKTEEAKNFYKSMH